MEEGDAQLYADYVLKEDQEDEEEELEYGLHSCLPVLDVDKKQLSEYAKKSWTLEPPTTAEEYLLRVRLECKKCEQTKVAENYKQIKQKYETISNGIDNKEEPATKKQKKEHDEPFLRWRNQCVSQFIKTRQLVEQKTNQQLKSKQFDLPGRKEWEKWKAFCFTLNDSSDAIFQMDSLQITHLFQRMVQWIMEDSMLEKQRFLWLHGLMTALDYPLTAENAACLNQLFQWAHQQRESLSEEQQLFASHLNTLLVIINDFFKQGNSDWI